MPRPVGIPFLDDVRREAEEKAKTLTEASNRVAEGLATLNRSVAALTTEIEALRRDLQNQRK